MNIFDLLRLNQQHLLRQMLTQPVLQSFQHKCVERRKQQQSLRYSVLAWLCLLPVLWMPMQVSAVQLPQQVTVKVFASDPVNARRLLHYSWQVSEGSIVNVDAPTTTWTIPKGSGVHFANVLVSNRLGGYTERRIAVISDDLGIAADVVRNSDFYPPSSNLNQIQTSETEFVVAADSDFQRSFNAAEGLYGNGTGTFKRAVYIPDVNSTYTDLFSNQVFPATSNLSGRISVWNSDHPICCLDGNFPYGHPHTHVNADASENAFSYIVGSAMIQGGGICGVENKLHKVQSTATAVLLDITQQIALSRPARVNHFGDYALPWNPLAWYVKVSCENNPAIIVPIDKLTQVANTAVFKGSAPPVVSTITASIAGVALGTDKAVFLPPDTDPAAVAPLPSSKFPRTDHFLAFKGLDNAQSACEYYRTTGAVKSCSAAGVPLGAVTFEAWKAKVGLGAYRNTGVFTGQKAIEYSATYINRIDLNLTRNHHAITYPLGARNRTAAYVCNHLGPTTDSQTDVNIAIANAIKGRNLVACVAMDYGYELANGNAYVRYFTFAPNGQLLMSVNLDGRGEKYMPGTCVACHGGSKYDGQFPMDARTSPDFGGHFLPYDVGNFAFSQARGYTKADQQNAIYHLNKIVQTTNMLQIGQDLINGWYHNDTQTVTDQNYIPQDWKDAMAAMPDITQATFYKNLYLKVEAPYCRSCHIAMQAEGRVTDNPEDVNNWLGNGSPSSDNAFKQVICGGAATVQRNHAMPNSLVTFNRMWSDPVAVALVKKWSGDINCLTRLDPKLK